MVPRFLKIEFALILTVALVLPASANGAGIQGPRGISQKAAGRSAANETLSLAFRRPERIDRLQMPPPPRAVLEIYNVAFDPKWKPLEVGLPIGIYVAIRNKGPAGSTTTDFRVYLSYKGRVLEKRRIPLSGGLRAGRATSTNFQITLPDKPGRHCWEVSLRQTDQGRMTLEGPKTICASLKTKPISAPMKRRP